MRLLCWELPLQATHNKNQFTVFYLAEETVNPCGKLKKEKLIIFYYKLSVLLELLNNK